eukprot:UN10249
MGATVVSDTVGSGAKVVGSGICVAIGVVFTTGASVGASVVFWFFNDCRHWVFWSQCCLRFFDLCGLRFIRALCRFWFVFDLGRLRFT